MIAFRTRGEKEMKNVFQDMPYADGKMGNRQLVNEKYL